MSRSKTAADAGFSLKRRETYSVIEAKTTEIWSTEDIVAFQAGMLGFIKYIILAY